MKNSTELEPSKARKLRRLAIIGLLLCAALLNVAWIVTDPALDALISACLLLIAILALWE